MVLNPINSFMTKFVSVVATAVSLSAGITSDYDNPKLKAAGTLLYATDPKTGQVMVLLSKERIWDDVNSGRWKAFGGKRDPGENLVQTALRETKEESRGIVQLSLADIDFNRLIAVEHTACKYLQLVVPIEYDPAINARFQDTRHEDTHFMEKTEVRWVPLTAVVEAVKKADLEAQAKGCRPYHCDAVVEYNGDTLVLGRDFAETMVIMHREAPAMLQSLQSPSSVLLSDADWVKTN